jgi:hypothetical protein
MREKKREKGDMQGKQARGFSALVKRENFLHW